uniref:Uncharacterized protein n=1 Tax=Setaria viridis TaxID=4556 RepID=A0A4U6U4R7_SETVI|nr:hypothetical protein SEVIR_6G021900v2 [Setaria viridis]
MLVPCAPHPTSFYPYSLWGWNDPWVHTPSHFRPYHVEYVAPREPSCARQPYVKNDQFEENDRSSVQNKNKVVKQVYRVKRDGCKGTSKLNKAENKKRALLSKTEAKSNHPLGLSNWQKKKLQKLSAQDLRKKSMAWVPKRSIQTQSKDDVQAKGVTQLKEKREFERQSPKLRFTPNHQNFWSVPHPFALQIPYVPISWNSSLDMSGCPSHSYFDPWSYGSLYHRGLSPNCYAH